MSEAPKPEAPKRPDIIEARFEEVKPGLRDAIAKARANATDAWKKTLGWFDQKEQEHTGRRESKKKEREDARKAEIQKAVDRGKTLVTTDQLRALEDAADSGSAGFTRDDLHAILARASATPGGPKVLKGTREEGIVIQHMNKVLEEARRPKAERERLNILGAQKLKDAEQLDDLDALVDVGAVSRKDADLFLILHGMEDADRHTATTPELAIYRAVLGQITAEQTAFDDKFFAFAKKNRFTEAETRAIRDAIDTETDGLTRKLMLRYMAKPNATLATRTRPVADIIKDAVAQVRFEVHDPARKDQLDQLMRDGLITDIERRAYGRAVAKFAQPSKLGVRTVLTSEERIILQKVDRILTAQELVVPLQRMGWDDADIARLSTIATRYTNVPTTYQEGNEPPQDADEDVKLWYRALQQADLQRILETSGNL